MQIISLNFPNTVEKQTMQKKKMKAKQIAQKIAKFCLINKLACVLTLT